MTFLQPAFLWGLLALAIPIIVHFFYLRRARRYEFSQAALVERLRQASRPYLRLRHWILLLLRLALVTVIVFLFARPVLGDYLPIRAEGASVVIVWDVSPSTKPAFERGRMLLRQLLREAPAAYEYRLLTTDSYLPRGEFVSARLLADMLDGVVPASMGYPIASILEKAELLFAGAQYPIRKVYILSDFQSTSVGDLGRIPQNAFSEVILLPLATDLQGNAYIDSLRGEWSQSGWKVSFTLRGESGRLYTVQVGEQRASRLPGTYEERLPPSTSHVEIRIEGDGIDFDNQAWVGLMGQHHLRVGWGEVLSPAFRRLHQLLGVEVREHSSVDPTIPIYVGSLTGLPEGIEGWIKEGGTLITHPSAELSPAQWQSSFLADEVLFAFPKSILQPLLIRPANASFWEGVFLPSGERPAFIAEPLRVSQIYPFAARAGQLLLVDESGLPLLWEIPYGKGRVYLFTFPWSGSSLEHHSVVVPLFARMYQWDSGENMVWEARSGEKRLFSIEGAERPRLRHLASGVEYIPPAEKRGGVWQFAVGDAPLPLGLYEVRNGEKTSAFLGVNVSTQESHAVPIPLEAWTERGIPAKVLQWEKGALQEKSIGFALRSWHLWLGLALLFLMVETYWARRLLRPATTAVPSP